VALAAFLVLLGNAAALSQSTTPAARQQSPRAAVDLPVVLTQVPVGSATGEPGPGPHAGADAQPGPGARLVLLARDGTTRVLTSSFHSACDPDVSVDGGRILFAGQTAAGGDWNIHEMDMQSLTTRPVTRNAGNCRSPIYTSIFYTITEKEPWEQIAFVSTLASQADERGAGPATSLYTCKLDGSFPQRITYNLSSDLDPAIMADGRLVYAAWHRATFDDGVRGRLVVEGINTDGSDRAPLVSRRGGQLQRMPCVTTGGLLVFVEVDPSAGVGAGRLSCVSLRRPLHTYRSITGPRDGLFYSPSPLPDGRILVSWRPADGSASFGLYRLDPATGQRELVFDDPRYHEIRARAVHVRRRPDGRSSVVSAEDPLAKLYCMSVYLTEFKNRAWLAPGSVKTLRVIEGVPAPLTGRGGEGLTLASIPQLAARRILAEAPVKQDGSFQLTVPASTPIQLQILDDQGIALRSCGWIWARNHQAQGCIGCHEDPELTPPNRVPDALNDAPAVAAVPIERRITVDFAEQIAPIVSSKCVPCHRAGDRAADLDLAGETEVGGRGGGKLDRLYQALLAPVRAADPTSGLGKYVHPGRARTSPLVWHILGRNTARPWDGEAAGENAKPIPAGKSEPLTVVEKQTIIRWIDLGARRIAEPEATPKAETWP
jgi:hypothetical protein